MVDNWYEMCVGECPAAYDCDQEVPSPERIAAGSCIVCANGYTMTNDNKCVDLSNVNSWTVAPSPEPTGFEYGLSFAVMYRYNLPVDHCTSDCSAINVTTEAVETAEDFMNQTLTESENVNASCVRSTDFDVFIDDNDQEVNIIGSIYVCDNETVFALIERITNNIKLKSENLIIIEDTVEIVAEVVTVTNEHKISSSLPPTDWNAVIDTERTDSSDHYIITIIVISMVLVATCGILAFTAWRFSSTSSRYGTDIVHIVVDEMKPVNLVIPCSAEYQPGAIKDLENENHSEEHCIKVTAGVDLGDV